MPIPGTKGRKAILEALDCCQKMMLQKATNGGPREMDPKTSAHIDWMLLRIALAFIGVCFVGILFHYVYEYGF